MAPTVGTGDAPEVGKEGLGGTFKPIPKVGKGDRLGEGVSKDVEVGRGFNEGTETAFSPISLSAVAIFSPVLFCSRRRLAY